VHATMRRCLETAAAHAAAAARRVAEPAALRGRGLQRTFRQRVGVVTLWRRCAAALCAVAAAVRRRMGGRLSRTWRLRLIGCRGVARLAAGWLGGWQWWRASVGLGCGGGRAAESSDVASSADRLRASRGWLQLAGRVAGSGGVFTCYLLSVPRLCCARRRRPTGIANGWWFAVRVCGHSVAWRVSLVSRTSAYHYHMLLHDRLPRSSSHRA
jgi:hypothetical protein